DLHQPILSFFKNLDQSKMVDGVEHITLHKLLTMRSGIRISEEQRAAMDEDPSLLKGVKELQIHLEKTATITPDSQTFKYSGDPSLVMQVLESVTPNGAKQFIKTELLDKLGIENYKWETAPSGLPEAGWRVRMTSRDMLKWGLLVANKGQWEGAQLVAEAYIKEATSRVLYTRQEELHYGGKDVMNQGYGYYFWNADLKVGNRTYFSYSAQGGGGQFIVFVEELDLIIVFTAYDNKVNYLQIVAESILPAFLTEQ
ncbi:MAG: serine hydrolase, partial [Bacteroidota bacterium]